MTASVEAQQLHPFADRVQQRRNVSADKVACIARSCQQAEIYKWDDLEPARHFLLSAHKDKRPTKTTFRTGAAICFHIIFTYVVEVRDSPHEIFGSWARWTRAPPRFQSSWETAVAAAAVAVD